MGVDLTFYSVYGVMIDTEKHSWDDLWEVNDDLNGLTPENGTNLPDLVFDGMCENYAVAGIILADIDMYGGETDQYVFTSDIDPGLEDTRDILLNNCREHLPELYEMIKNVDDWKFMSILHYS